MGKMFRKAVLGNRKTTLAAAIAGLLVSFGVVSNPEQAQALGALLAAVIVLIIGQAMSKDGDKEDEKDAKK